MSSLYGCLQQNQGLSFLHLEIALSFAKLCYAFKEKKILCYYKFMKKGHSKLSKDQLKNIPSIKITYLQRDLKD